MHLGMSGSFRVLSKARRTTPGEFHHPRGKDRAHDHVVFHMSSGADVVFNDPRRFGYMKIIARNALERRAAVEGARPRTARQRIRCQHAGACLRQQEDQPEGGAARSARGRGPRQHLCLRGAVPRASVAATAGGDAGDQDKVEPTDHARRLVDAIHAVLNQAIKAGGSSLRDHRQTSGELGYFQHSFQVYDREGEKCQTAGCAGIVRRFTQNGRSTFWCPKCQK